MGFSNVDAEPHGTNEYLAELGGAARMVASRKVARHAVGGAYRCAVNSGRRLRSRGDLRKKANDEVQRIAMDEQEPIIYLVNPDYLCAISPREVQRARSHVGAAAGALEHRVVAA